MLWVIITWIIIMGNNNNYLISPTQEPQHILISARLDTVAVPCRKRTGEWSMETIISQAFITVGTAA